MPCSRTDGKFIEVFVDTPLDECMRRDPKGLYGKATAGLITDFTGIGSRYERPEKPDLTVTTVGHTVASVVDEILSAIRFT